MAYKAKKLALGGKIGQLGGNYLKAMGDIGLSAFGLKNVIGDEAYKGKSAGFFNKTANSFGAVNEALLPAAVGFVTGGLGTGAVTSLQQGMNGVGANVENPEALAAQQAYMNNYNRNQYAMGGQLTQYQGNQHEQGGIPIGQNAEVEGGETKFTDYIFSDKLKQPKTGKTFATVSKKIEDKYGLRVNDKMSEMAKKTELENLKLEQETVRQKKLNSLAKRAGELSSPQMRYGGRIKYEGGGGGIELNAKQVDNPLYPSQGAYNTFPQNDVMLQNLNTNPDSQAIRVLRTGEGIYTLNSDGKWTLTDVNGTITPVVDENIINNVLIPSLKELDKTSPSIKGTGEVTKMPPNYTPLTTPATLNFSGYSNPMNNPSPRVDDAVAYDASSTTRTPSRFSQWLQKPIGGEGSNATNRLNSWFNKPETEEANALENLGLKRARPLVASAGDLYDIGRGVKNLINPDKQYVRGAYSQDAKANLIDDSADRQRIRTAFSGANRNLRRTSSGLGNYMTNRLASAMGEAQGIGNLANSTNTANANILNQVGQFNSQLRGATSQFNARQLNLYDDNVQREHDVASNKIQSGLAGIGRNYAQGVLDYNNNTVQANALGSMDTENFDYTITKDGIQITRKKQ